MNARQEWTAAGALLGRGLSSTVGIVADTHRAIATTVENCSPPTVAKVARAHHLGAQATYTAVGRAHGIAPVLAAELGTRVAGERLVPLSRTRSGHSALRWVNGLFGDQLAAAGSPLAFTMSIRVDDEDVAPAELPARFPDAAPDVVVFIHGLTETERCWSRGGRIPQRLETETGISCVLLRYNTGLRVQDNAASLDRLLEDLVAAWPVPVRSLSLVGHSMGGLVARSACHHAADADRRWVAALDAVITLGTPHHGSPWEKLAHASDRLMSRVPHTAAIGRILAARSDGIRDLRFGTQAQGELPPARYYWVAGSVTDDARHPVALAIGDGLVRTPSAAGRGRRDVHMDAGAHVGGAGHMALISDDAVYALLADWLTPASG